MRTFKNAKKRNGFVSRGFATEWTVAGDATARTITLPLKDSGTFDCFVYWGDGSRSRIKAYDDANIEHTYATDGTYEVIIVGECPGWGFDNAGDKLKITDIYSWGKGKSFRGFSNLTGGFHGCSNLKSTGADKIIAKSGLTNVKSLFQGCSTITGVTTGLFDECANLAAQGFMYTFHGCSSLATVPNHLFRLNTNVSTEGFYGTFDQCINLQLNEFVFCADGEEDTRFLNKVSDFTDCFYRASFTGTQGVAPKLWDYDFGTETPVSEDCFAGDGNSAVSISNYEDIPSEWGAGSGFITEWTVSGDATARTITLPFTNNGTFDCTVDWGDGYSSEITAYNDADRAHTYAANGTYEVTIVGEAPGWSFNNGGDKLKLTDIVNWGSDNLFGGFSYLTGGFYGCTNLKTTGEGKIIAKSTLTTLQNCFRTCTTITGITAGVFDNCTELAASAFYSTFLGCSNLATIPTDLFRFNTKVSSNGFRECFYQCSNLTELPTDLFRYNTAVSTSGFLTTFRESGLTSIPENLFRYNANVSGSCFKETFRACTSLTTIPADLFRYNVNADTGAFDTTFGLCTLLETVPEGLFRYNSSVETNGFQGCFHSCYKLQLNQYIFYASGEENTRFLNKSPSFLNTFYRTSFTGTQGTAPELWNCDFGTGTPVTGAFSGAGNSTTSLTNYSSIPSAWGGPA